MYRRTVGALLLVFILFFLAIGVSFAEAPQNTAKLAQKAEPAVVLVQATYEADVEVVYPYLNPNKLDTLFNRIVEQVMLGLIPADDSAMLKAVADELRAHPKEYLQKSAQKETVHTGYHALGSGFIVTPDGYLVTNAHVVAPDEALLKQQLLGTILDQCADSFVKKVIKSPDSIPANAKNYVLDAVSDMGMAFLKENMEVRNLKKSFHIGMGVQKPGPALLQKGIQAEFVQTGGTMPKQDVAILKMAGQDNLPTLSLGDPSQQVAENKTYILGYTGLASFHQLSTEVPQAQPSLREGQMAVQKLQQADCEVFQTKDSEAIENCGGPILNEQGEVIGLATPSMVQNTVHKVPGLYFMISSTEVQSILASANVIPTESLVTKTYNKAIDSYYKQHYKKALKKFQEVATLCPSHPYVQNLIDDSTVAISEGRDKSIPAWLLFGVPAVVVIGIVVAVVLVGRKKKEAKVAAAEEDAKKDEEEPKQKEQEKDKSKK